MLNLYITSHSNKYIRNYQTLKKQIENKYSDVRLCFLFSTVRPENIKDLPAEFEFLMTKDLDKQLRSKINFENLVKRVSRFNLIYPLDIHRSDLRLEQGLVNINQLLLEQVILSERIEEIFKKNNPHLVFVSSGTNILHTIAYHLARFNKSKVYRIHNYINLNTNYIGQRVWFCSNNKMNLSKDEIDKFNYHKKDLNNFIKKLHKSILDRSFEPGMMQKEFRKRRMPINLKDLFNDLLRILFFKIFYFYNPILSNKANLSIDRLKKLVNAFLFKFIVKEPSDLSGKYILFPLNTPYDSQILIRAPEYRSFIGLIDLIAYMIPVGYQFVIREHPSFPGMLDFQSFQKLLKKHKHLKIVSCEVPMSPLIKKSKAVICINNTAFVESLLLFKPTITLSNGYFSNQGITEEISQLGDLREVLQKCINKKNKITTHIELESVMSELLKETFPAPDVIYNDKLLTINDGIITKLSRIIYIFGSFENFIKNL